MSRQRFPLDFFFITDSSGSHEGSSNGRQEEKEKEGMNSGREKLPWSSLTGSFHEWIPLNSQTLSLFFSRERFLWVRLRCQRSTLQTSSHLIILRTTSTRYNQRRKRCTRIGKPIQLPNYETKVTRFQLAHASVYFKNIFHANPRQHRFTFEAAEQIHPTAFRYLVGELYKPWSCCFDSIHEMPPSPDWIQQIAVLADHFQLQPPYLKAVFGKWQSFLKDHLDLFWSCLRPMHSERLLDPTIAQWSNEFYEEDTMRRLLTSDGLEQLSAHQIMALHKSLFLDRSSLQKWCWVRWFKGKRGWGEKPEANDGIPDEAVLFAWFEETVERQWRFDYRGYREW